MCTNTNLLQDERVSQDVTGVQPSSKNKQEKKKEKKDLKSKNTWGWLGWF
jgi:hypothetical protein